MQGRWTVDFGTGNGPQWQSACMQEDWVNSLAMHTPKKEKKKEKQVIPAHLAYCRRKPAAICPAQRGSHAGKGLTAVLAALPTSPSEDPRLAWRTETR